MRITARQLKQIIREAVDDIAPTTDLQDITTPRERKNGTTTLQDPVTADVYKLNVNGYVRRYSPDWELNGSAGKSAQPFQHQQPVILRAPAHGTGKQYFDQRAGRMMRGGSYTRGEASTTPEQMRQAQMDALNKSVAKRRADLKSREQFAAKNQAIQTRTDRDDGTVRFRHKY